MHTVTAPFPHEALTGGPWPVRSPPLFPSPSGCKQRKKFQLFIGADLVIHYSYLKSVHAKINQEGLQSGGISGFDPPPQDLIF